MGYNTQIFDTYHEHLVGKLFRSNTCGEIVKLEMPEDRSILTVCAQDLSVKKIKVMNEYIPVFAENRVEYIGQPVLAVFGEDIESVETFIKQIKLEVDESAVERSSQPLKPFTFTKGDISKYFLTEERVVSSDSIIDSYGETLLSAQRIFAKIEDGTVYIKVPSQWPLHVKESVAIAMQTDSDGVFVISETVHTEYNQLVISPSFAAVITATASRKADMMCVLQDSFTSWQPQTVYHLETQFDENNRILAHRVNVDIDMGPFPIITDEIFNHITAGLVPVYKTNALEINIKPVKNSSHPITFFADLGYGISLAVTENHFNYASHKFNFSPSVWRIENLTESNAFSETFRKSTDFTAIGKTVEEAVKDSYFERENAVYTQISAKNRLGRSIFSYSRGIGVSCGQGIQGFSNAFAYVPHYFVNITLTDTEKIIVNLGFQTDRHLKRIFRELIQKYFEVEYQNISFTDINEPYIRDAGPNVLSRGIGLISKMIENACKTIKEKLKKGESLPLSADGFFNNIQIAPYFESLCCGTVIVDMHLDTVRIVPVIDHITARIKCGKVFDAQALSESIRHTISETIGEICPYADNLAEIDLKIRSNPNAAPGSCSSLIRGLTGASVITALSQALSYNIPKIPVSETELMEFLKQQGEHHASEMQN